MLYLYGHKIGGCVPFYIDWGQCDHPSASIPEVGSLKSLIIRAPAGHKVHDLLSAVNGIEVEEGEPMLEFAFGSPEGTITFSADNPVGVKFPGFEEGDTGAATADDAGNYKVPAKPELLPISGEGDGDDDDEDNDDSDSDEDDSDDDSDSSDDSDDDSVEVSDTDSD